DHQFVRELPGDGTYFVRLLEGVQIEKRNDTWVGRWPAFNLEAEGESEAEVYQQLLDSLQEQIGDLGSPEYQPFAAYVGEHGRRLSDEESATHYLVQLHKFTVRWRVRDDEQYEVRLWQDSELQRDGATFTLRAFGLEHTGQFVGPTL